MNFVLMSFLLKKNSMKIINFSKHTEKNRSESVCCFISLILFFKSDFRISCYKVYFVFREK